MLMQGCDLSSQCICDSSLLILSAGSHCSSDPVQVQSQRRHAAHTRQGGGRDSRAMAFRELPTCVAGEQGCRRGQCRRRAHEWQMKVEALFRGRRGTGLRARAPEPVGQVSRMSRLRQAPGQCANLPG